ncbi:unnamed protein product [Rotaria sordida]|uniref:Uncharacterized protein n=1 Tax=Rotaria sordida TaxID=392033 RepID=A0A813MYA4_9BILA|nr:unnamed protein product [Rotaria sordida]CAF0757306.1 unnamed protein product [Rotaria sordida]CAF0787823.1 unnamed protein product [Rotaria sordida]CAF3749562.1 unnamed protein product [Rotaria sordida]
MEHPSILEWYTKYVRALKFTNHALFDFIVSDGDGRKLYENKFNPYVNSAITAFYHYSNTTDIFFRSDH